MMNEARAAGHLALPSKLVALRQTHLESSTDNLMSILEELKLV